MDALAAMDVDGEAAAAAVAGAEAGGAAAAPIGRQRPAAGAGRRSHLLGDAASDSSSDDRGDSDLEVDLEDIWAGAVCGIPVPEHLVIAKECVAGRRRGPPGGAPSKAYVGLLKEAARGRNRKLLQSRLSHLAEGEYDLEGDVARPYAEGPRCGVDAPWMDTDARSGTEALAAAAAPAVFRRRDAGAAKANGRRAASARVDLDVLDA